MTVQASDVSVNQTGPARWPRIALARRAVMALVLIRDFFLTALTLPFILPLWFLSWPSAAALGRFYGRCAYWIWPTARRVSMINLRRAYGRRMSTKRAKTATRAILRNLGESIAETAQFARARRRGSLQVDQICIPDDPDLAARILADPRPKIFVTGHLGSWEIAIMELTSHAEIRGAAIARRIDNPFLNYLVRRVRLEDPSQWIEKKGAVEAARERLSNGVYIAMLLDENGGERGPFIPFFGRHASTRKTAALLSLVTGAPIVIGAAIRTGRRGATPKFRHRVAWIDPIERGWSGPEATLPLTTEIVETYERWVRERPLQWRWVHWRWKRRPDGSNEKYGRSELAAAFAEEQS